MTAGQQDTHAAVRYLRESDRRAAVRAAAVARRSAELGLLAAVAATTGDPAAFLGLDDMDMTGIDEDVACELLEARGLL